MSWQLVDQRTGRPCSIETFPTRELAQRTLNGYIARDARGGRPDLRDLMPHVIVGRKNG